VLAFKWSCADLRRVTMSVYQHVDDEMIDRAAQGLEDAFGA
jgi:hypothetical protein